MVAEGAKGGGELGQEPVQLLAVEARIVSSSIHDRGKGIAKSISYVNSFSTIFRMPITPDDVSDDREMIYDDPI